MALCIFNLIICIFILNILKVKFLAIRLILINHFNLHLFFFRKEILEVHLRNIKKIRKLRYEDGGFLKKSDFI